MTKKTVAVIAALLLVVSVALCGCSADGLLKALSIDIDTYDPAIEMVSGVLEKTVAQENLVSGGFTYLVFEDGTAAVTQYKGSDTVLVIPEELDGHTVVALENKALYKNTNITELVLPDSLEVVGNFAVMYCNKLEKVTFGKNIKNIGVSAFESQGDDSNGKGDGSLQSIVFNGAPEIIREKAFYYSDKLLEIVIPDGVRIIEEWAFAKSLAADKIILGEGLEEIGDHAFLKCRAVKEIVIPGSCKTVRVSAFYQCTSVEKLTIGEGVEVLEKGAFEECSALKSVVLPDSIRTMEPYIFYNCSSLSECTAGDVDVLEKDIFSGTDNIKITAPAGSALEAYAAKNHLHFEARA